MSRHYAVQSLFALFVLFHTAWAMSAEPEVAEPQVSPRPRTTLPPIDEAKSDPTLMAFRTRVLNALMTNDARFLAQHSAPDLGMDASEWTAKNSKEGPDPFYTELIRAVRLGGTFTTTRGSQEGRREFCAPYVYSAFPADYPPLPGDEINNEGHPWAITGRNVPVRRRPSSTAPVITRLQRFELVLPTTLASPVEHPRWYQITTPDRKVGWVRAGEILDPADVHVCFAKLDGDWKISVIARSMPSI